jgi:hypothetical protein
MKNRHNTLLVVLFLFTVNQLVIGQDNRKGTWLPDSKVKNRDKTIEQVNDFLKTLEGSFRPMVCGYDSVVLASSAVFENGTAKLRNSAWICKIVLSKVASQPDAMDLDLTFKLSGGELKSGGVAVAFDFMNWSRSNYVLVPGIVYNGNRFQVETNGYMAPYPKNYYYNKNVPLLFSNSPRLSLKEGIPAKIEALTGNAATPAMCFFSPERQRGFILLTEQQTRFGNSGMFIEENSAQNFASFVVSAPGVRELAAGFGDFRYSGDKGGVWKAGDDVRMKFLIYSFPAKDIPQLLEKFMEVRKALTGENHPRNLTPFSAVTEFTAIQKNNVRWLEKPAESFYRCENSDGYQLGWVGGLMDTYAMLALKDKVSRERVIKTYDFVVSRMAGKSGYFYGIYRDGKTASDRDNIPEATLVRKNSDALLWMIKHLQLFKLQGYGDLINPQWEKAAKRLAQAFVNTWEKNGEFGNYVNASSGEIIIFNSTSGAIAPAGLVLASQYFGEPEFLEIAKKAANLFYSRDVVKLGLTCAHSGDIMQDADADSGYGLVESLMALYYATSDKQWLGMAKTTANLSATWTLSYDYVFPEGSTLYNLKANVAGAVWASVQNKHAAPGICTTSGDYLFKLYRATGQRRYAELLKDIMHAHAEVMETPGRPTTGAGPGTSMERIQTTDADGKDAIGMILHGSNGWTEGNGLLMALENPGIYLQTDTEQLFVFDHVEVTVLSRDPSGVTLQITNPTRFDAKVSVFAESSQQAGIPMGFNEFLNWKKVDVKSGEIKKYKISI